MAEAEEVAPAAGLDYRLKGGGGLADGHNR